MIPVKDMLAKRAEETGEVKGMDDEGEAEEEEDHEAEEEEASAEGGSDGAE